MKPQLEYYRTFWKKEWRWRIKASNGRIIGSSSEGYKNRTDMMHNLKILRDAINQVIE